VLLSSSHQFAVAVLLNDLAFPQLIYDGHAHIESATGVSSAICRGRNLGGIGVRDANKDVSLQEEM
jgi:hypothetical protein